MRQDLLTLLNDLSYLIECAALDYTGELKTELGALCDRIRGEFAQVPEAVQALPQLERALESYRKGCKGDGASRLVSVNRSWWAVVPS